MEVRVETGTPHRMKGRATAEVHRQAGVEPQIYTAEDQLMKAQGQQPMPASASRTESRTSHKPTFSSDRRMAEARAAIRCRGERDIPHGERRFTPDETVLNRRAAGGQNARVRTALGSGSQEKVKIHARSRAEASGRWLWHGGTDLDQIDAPPGTQVRLPEVTSTAKVMSLKSRSPPPHRSSTWKEFPANRKWSYPSELADMKVKKALGLPS